MASGAFSPPWSLLAGPKVSLPSVARLRDELKELLPYLGSYPKVMIFYVESCLILTFLSCVPSLNGKVAARSPSLMGSLCRCVFVDGMNFKKTFHVTTEKNCLPH